MSTGAETVVSTGVIITVVSIRVESTIVESVEVVSSLVEGLQALMVNKRLHAIRIFFFFLFLNII